jgi:hypothetical protein
MLAFSLMQRAVVHQVQELGCCRRSQPGSTVSRIGDQCDRERFFGDARGAWGRVAGQGSDESSIALTIHAATCAQTMSVAIRNAAPSQASTYRALGSWALA